MSSARAQPNAVAGPSSQHHFTHRALHFVLPTLPVHTPPSLERRASSSSTSSAMSSVSSSSSSSSSPGPYTPRLSPSAAFMAATKSAPVHLEYQPRRPAFLRHNDADDQVELVDSSAPAESSAKRERGARASLPARPPLQRRDTPRPPLTLDTATYIRGAPHGTLRSVIDGGAWIVVDRA